MNNAFLLFALLGLTTDYLHPVASNSLVALGDNERDREIQPLRKKRATEEEPVAVCGKPIENLLFAAGGSTVLIQTSPWHAGIYLRSKTGEIEQACGGTLIAKSIVISAAHCFYDESYRRFYNTSLYKIGLGKQYRSWTAEENNAQYRDVAEVLVNRRYRGVRTHFNYDIALVVLSSPVEITTHVNVICVDWNNTFENEHLKEDSTGQSVGWGKLLNGSSSETLQGVYLPFVPFDTCYDALPDHAQNIYTSDKFCAGHRDKNTSVCQGDSGGGLSFYRNCDGRRYLRGIVSVSFKPAHDMSPCYAQLYTGFTLVSTYLNWIKENIDMEEVEKSSKPSPDCETKSKKPVLHVLRSNEMCSKFASMAEANTDDTTCEIATQSWLTERRLSRPREFPHMVALGHGDVRKITWSCDGSLISERYILTAAHCLNGPKDADAPMWARLGDWNSTRRGAADVRPGQQLIKVLEKIPHHLYKPPLIYNDIALLKLKEAVVFDAYVRPACLDSQHPVQEYTLSGFGRQNAASPRTESLLTGAVRLTDTLTCNKTYGTKGNKNKLPSGILHNSMMCFQPVDKLTDCVAVGGAPVQKVLDNPQCMYSIVGVTSFGATGCGKTDKPFVTSRVYFYRAWVENIVWPDLEF